MRAWAMKGESKEVRKMIALVQKINKQLRLFNTTTTTAHLDRPRE